MLSVLRDTDNIPASDSCTKHTAYQNDLQFHMDAYDRPTNLEKNLVDSVAIYGRGRTFFKPHRSPVLLTTTTLAHNAHPATTSLIKGPA